LGGHFDNVTADCAGNWNPCLRGLSERKIVIALMTGVDAGHSPDHSAALVLKACLEESGDPTEVV